eukprot:592879_1
MILFNVIELYHTACPSYIHNERKTFHKNIRKSTANRIKSTLMPFRFIYKHYLFIVCIYNEHKRSNNGHWHQSTHNKAGVKYDLIHCNSMQFYNTNTAHNTICLCTSERVQI